jgi:hypothetical protein
VRETADGEREENKIEKAERKKEEDQSQKKKITSVQKR